MLIGSNFPLKYVFKEMILHPKNGSKAFSAHANRKGKFYKLFATKFMITNEHHLKHIEEKK